MRQGEKKFSLYNYVGGKWEPKETFTGVTHAANGTVWASDRSILIEIPDDDPQFIGSGLVVTKAGKIIKASDITEDQIDALFEGPYEEYRIDKKATADALRKLSARMKAKGDRMPACVRVGGLRCFNGRRFLLFVKAMDHFGTDVCRVGRRGYLTCGGAGGRCVLAAMGGEVKNFADAVLL